MNAFIDITGASGTPYRFRRIEDAADLPAAAGAFVVLTPGPAGPQIACCGMARSLTQARTALASYGQGAVAYVRLNIARVVREKEHQDVVAAVRPAKVIDEEDLDLAG